MRILIVDDSEPFRFALRAILLEGGYENVETAPSALEAISLLENIQKNELPFDLIMMDIQMPDVSGIEAVKKIKQITPLKDIPIIIVSVRDDEINIEDAFKAGAIDFVGKPIKKLELFARVRSILTLKDEMDKRKQHEKELENTILQLQKALSEIKTLSGLLPICSNCKKVRDDKGYWKQVEHYIHEHSDAEFSHSICPECIRKLYPDMADDILKGND